ncbi:MAG TPA: hypothetical protein VGY53_06840, partial [Isosphaeraceae bacterium]|nr:hypothetical protein [Isosphaeraceae bacterium]
MVPWLVLLGRESRSTLGPVWALYEFLEPMELTMENTSFDALTARLDQVEQNNQRLVARLEHADRARRRWQWTGSAALLGVVVLAAGGAYKVDKLIETE